MSHNPEPNAPSGEPSPWSADNNPPQSNPFNSGATQPSGVTQQFDATQPLGAADPPPAGLPVDPAPASSTFPPPAQDQTAGWTAPTVQPDYAAPASGGSGVWDPAAQPVPYTPPEGTQAPSMTEAESALTAQMAGGAGWFYWIAGLTGVNSLLSLFNSSWGFAFGLEITRIFDYIGMQMAGDGMAFGKPLAMVLDVMVLAVYVFLGMQASKGRSWAFIVGLVLIALDGILSLIMVHWIGIIAHAAALFFIFPGFSAARQLARLPKEPAYGAAYQYQPPAQPSDPSAPPSGPPTPPPSQW